MSDQSPRFALPFLLPGQAQKELYHNEALIVVDALLHPVAENILAAPPLNPLPGQCWIVGEGASDAWSSRDRQLAVWTESGWRFVSPTAGMVVWDRFATLPRQWDGARWGDGRLSGAGLIVDGDQVVGTRQPIVPNPSGGTIIDEEARTAIGALIATLMSHGLIA